MKIEFIYSYPNLYFLNLNSFIIILLSKINIKECFFQDLCLDKIIKVLRLLLDKEMFRNLGNLKIFLCLKEHSIRACQVLIHSLQEDTSLGNPHPLFIQQYYFLCILSDTCVHIRRKLSRIQPMFASKYHKGQLKNITYYLLVQNFQLSYLLIISKEFFPLSLGQKQYFQYSSFILTLKAFSSVLLLMIEMKNINCLIILGW